MKKTKRLGILTIVAGAFSLISMATYWLPTLMLYVFDLNAASSIGIIGGADGPTAIIGGADGPTAIYVASSSPILFWIRMLIPAAFLVLTVILGVSWRKFKKSGE